MKRTASEIEVLFKKIIAEIEQGSSLRAALRKYAPLRMSTFQNWLDKDKSKQDRYVRATQLRAEAIFEDILSIADENYKDTYVDENGIERTDHDVVQRAKLRIDSRKWMLAKMQPTKYGDKLDVTSGNRTLAVPAIVGMVIQNEATKTDEPNDDDML
jgi:hypothetical protein